MKRRPALHSTLLEEDMTMRSVVTSLLVTFAAVPAAAQGSVSLGPQIGFYKAQDAENFSVLGGAALRFKLSDVLGIEGSINYREEKYVHGYVSVRSWPVMITGLLYPLPVLYGAIGVGWYNTTISYNVPPGILAGLIAPSEETKQQFGWHFGGGLELPVGSSIKLVGDIRYVFLNYNFKTFPGSAGVNSNFYVVTAGLLFSL
jgi:opacity protein-like surface antigen